jgi:hypothetical protein
MGTGRMSRFALHIVAGLSPFIPYGTPISHQARAIVDQGLWVNFLTMETGVTFPVVG